ncbi:MAG: DUF58 domain-containing protein [Planctomycetaceae bacterium]
MPSGWLPGFSSREITNSEFVSNWVSWGAGLRAARVPWSSAGKPARSRQGRSHVTPEDIRQLALPRTEASSVDQLSCGSRRNHRGTHRRPAVESVARVECDAASLGLRLPLNLDAMSAIPDRRIDPATLMQIRSLGLRAPASCRGSGPGSIAVLTIGFSVEFTEYRPYVRATIRDISIGFCRADRCYLKRFEDETNLRVMLLVDYSRSMDYGSLGYTKLDYAKTLAATLGYFLLQQRDAVGLAPFTDVIEEYVPPAYRAGHLRRLLVQLERPPRPSVTRLAGCLEELGRRLLRRGMVVLISDFSARWQG